MSANLFNTYCYTSLSRSGTHQVNRPLDFIWFQAKIRFRRHRLKFYIAATFIAILFAYIFGIFTHLLELSYDDSTFVYSLHSPNFRFLIEAIKSNLHTPELQPLNNFSFTYNLNPTNKCAESRAFPPDPLTLLIVVKSAACNYRLRAAIRQTWGSETRFADINIRTVFMLGRCEPKAQISAASSHRSTCPIIDPAADFARNRLRFSTLSWLTELIDPESSQLNPEYVTPNNGSRFRSPTNGFVDCQRMIDAEHGAHHDLVQANFIDSYYNNTLKTMSSLHWAATYCANVPLALFADDDYYVSVKNLLKFTRNFFHRVTHTAEYHDEDHGDVDSSSQNDFQSRSRSSSSSSALSWSPPIRFDGRLYSGYVFPHSRPMRHLTSKWYISLREYPYSRYPPYVTGGCFLLNNRTLSDLYHASIYTRRFKFDDVYLGILAKKMDIELVHNAAVWFDKLRYDARSYARIIASHGYDRPEELIRVWNEQKSLGNA